ncbi:uncharacterized protein LOC119036833 isoform X2 [Artibeus jamaicensis]|uniref:uncharacterized protein LOC119036833 isoform X2 n=1 Tax=Artibeus jamaicensis TaxID=9417 RepID=UPI00235AD370|nr:uncharacterized protein LOC119036833 isoform X2 [Artibeus jamaicensis]
MCCKRRPDSSGPAPPHTAPGARSHTEQPQQTQQQQQQQLHQQNLLPLKSDDPEPRGLFLQKSVLIFMSPSILRLQNIMSDHLDTHTHTHTHTSPPVLINMPSRKTHSRSHNYYWKKKCYLSSVLFHATSAIPQDLSVARVCEMEMKARQLNNRRSKTKSYSPACLRTVQIESKTRRGNRGAEAGNPPAPRPAAPASLRPSSPVFVSGLCNRQGGRRAARGGREVRKFAAAAHWQARRLSSFLEKSISFSLPHVAAAGATSGCSFIRLLPNFSTQRTSFPGRPQLSRGPSGKSALTQSHPTDPRCRHCKPGRHFGPCGSAYSPRGQGPLSPAGHMVKKSVPEGNPVGIQGQCSLACMRSALIKSSLLYADNVSSIISASTPSSQASWTCPQEGSWAVWLAARA